MKAGGKERDRRKMALSFEGIKYKYPNVLAQTASEHLPVLCGNLPLSRKGHSMPSLPAFLDIIVLLHLMFTPVEGAVLTG